LVSIPRIQRLYSWCIEMVFVREQP